MNVAEVPNAAPPRRLLDFWSVGWVFLLALLMCAAVVWLWYTRLPQRAYTVGDGRHADTYRFDLNTLLVPREEIIAAGFPKDGLQAMVNPAAFSVDEAEAYSKQLRSAHQGKFLVDGDRIIGVVLNGEARAYPISILNWHEVVNDTLGGTPIAVTYNPLCDSAVVFDRRVGDETLTFGVSGLVYNSNLLMFDRRPAGAQPHESLWSQLQFRAVAGPAAGASTPLTLIPARVMHWHDWLAEHPQTTVLSPDRTRSQIYRRTYAPYFGDDNLRFHVAPLPADDLPRKTPVLAVRLADCWHVFKLPEVRAACDASGVWKTTVDGVALELHTRGNPDVLWATRADGEPLQTINTLWFAWYAMHEGAGG